MSVIRRLAYYLLFLPLFVVGFVFGPYFVMQYSISILSSFAVIMLKKRELAAFTLIVFLLYFGYWRFVSLSYGQVDLSAVCYCGISWSFLHRHLFV